VTYLAPGVYIEEVPSGPQPIAAAPTSVMAIVGTTERGPYLEPKRITGWGQYLEVYGGTTDVGLTAESIFGFFENGGPAAYVVRVDPSIAAEWIVRDAAGAEAFRIAASSPGAWANDLQVSVAPDEAGGSGLLYAGRVTAAVTVTGNAATTVSVESTAGIAVGDAVVVVPAVGGAAAECSVEGVTATSITVRKPNAGNVALAVGDRIAAVADAGDTTVTLAAANGLRTGDLLVAELPDLTRVAASVASAANAGAGMVLTLASGLPSAVPGVQLATRTARFRGTIGTLAAANVALGAVTWADDDAVRPQPTDILSGNFRAYATGGLRGTWVPAQTRFEFPAIPPPGPIEVEAAIMAIRYKETVALTNPTVEQLTTQFGFVPTGGKVKLTHATGDTTVTRTAASFTVDAGDLNHTYTAAEALLPADASTGVVVRCARDVRVDDVIDFGGANQLRVSSVTHPGGTIQVLDFTATTNISAAAGDRFAVKAIEATRLYPLRFAVTVSLGGSVAEAFTSLALDPAHPFYYFKEGQINELARNITVTERAAGPITEASLPTTVEVSRPGSDQAAQPSDFRAGFDALEPEPEPAMVTCPETTKMEDPLIAADVIGAMVTHCQTFRRLAVVDAPDLADDQELVTWRNHTVASTYAAVYAPHVQIVSLDPDSIERFAYVPPSGFVTGVMARVDRTPPGVAKAPANEQVSGIVGLSQTYTHRRQELLNPNAVNILRPFPGRGIRIWGARNATDDTQFRYVNVRRLFNAIETSIERGTQWVVFESNVASTWLRVKVSVEGFLEQRWRAGELAGGTPAEAFRVRVGLGDTMTEDQVDLGLVIVEVAIAPAKPAEFVVFRFSHKRLSE
jgi:Bacteriophage tail sheath protein